MVAEGIFHEDLSCIRRETEGLVLACRQRRVMRRLKGWSGRFPSSRRKHPLEATIHFAAERNRYARISKLHGAQVRDPGSQGNLLPETTGLRALSSTESQKCRLLRSNCEYYKGSYALVSTPGQCPTAKELLAGKETKRTSAAADYMTIFQGGTTAQLGFPVGSDTRGAIDYAWGETQKYLCILAVTITVLAFPAVYIWKDYRVDRKQVKGTVL
ncbi:hypothetical protein SEPCBS119000_001822 [Sporothrix epigloea]|uniref:Uncharacterized protein n=1 Tax=Sporothrix epigloea TaxID=1892477 RepID=A0ABP0DFX4_9PEZI